MAEPTDTERAREVAMRARCLAHIHERRCDRGCETVFEDENEDHHTTACNKLTYDIAEALTQARLDAFREAAEVAEEFSWVLPVYADQAMNEVSDDAACAVQEQIAAAIRARAGKEG